MTYRSPLIVQPLKEVRRYLTASPQSRLRQLAALRQLDDRLLADIGVTRREASGGRSSRRNAVTTDLAAEAAGGPPMNEAILFCEPLVVVRDTTDADMPAIQAIYAHQVLHGLASFEEAPPTTDDLRSRRDRVLTAGLPYLTAEVNGRVVGYSYAAGYRPRPAYRDTVEDSLYVAEGMRGQGIGRALLAALIARCERGPWRQMVAVIGDSGNDGSIALHRRFGFRRVGTLEAVGFKLGRWIDTVLMQRPLGAGHQAPPGG